MLEPALQAAGHPGSQRGQGLFIKPSTQSEISFYQAMEDQKLELRFCTPKYMGTLTPGTTDFSAVNSEACNELLDGDCLPPQGSAPYIVLEDLLQTFAEPCIIDIKLGSVLWADNAAEEKIQRLKSVSNTTTSGSLHFRIAGMTTIDPETQERKVFGKEYGRAFKSSNVKEGLDEFLPKDYDRRTHVGVSVITFMRELANSLVESGVDLRSSSLLIIYEHDPDRAKKHFESLREKKALKQQTGEDEDNNSDDDDVWSSDSEHSPSSAAESDWHSSNGHVIDQNENIELRLIDFNHATFKGKPCDDVLLGLANLERIIAELCDLEDIEL